jgi:hypothetical protein
MVRIVGKLVFDLHPDLECMRTSHVRHGRTVVINDPVIARISWLRAEPKQVRLFQNRRFKRVGLLVTRQLFKIAGHGSLD